MIFRTILRILCYLLILVSSVILLLSINLDVKFGFNGKMDEFQEAHSILFKTELYITIIVISTFGLIILDFTRNKKKNEK